MKASEKYISTFALMMLITGALDSIRNLPTTALFGTSLIFFFIVAAITFLIPTALVSAELSATWTKVSGIYAWVKLAFGTHVAFLAIWLQWINTVIWYPTILSFIAGTAAFFIEPTLAQNRIFLLTTVPGIFWLLTLLNLRGIQTSANFASICTIIGLIIPMAAIILLGCIWILIDAPIQISWTTHTLLPNFGHSQNWISLTAIITAFLGMELATVHVRSVEKPQIAFPKAMFFSVLIILITMVAGSLAIAIVVPHDQINLVDGVLQAFQIFFKAFHIEWLMPVLTLMILIGSLGGMINWIISPAKGLLQAANDGFLPHFLLKQNKHGVSSRILILQAILVTIVCGAFLLMPSVNASYWLLTDLSTQLYVIMYLFMFAAAIYQRYKYQHKHRPFRIPGGKIGLWVVCLVGILGCIITAIVGFIPPSNIDTGGAKYFQLSFTGGMILFVLPIIFFYFMRDKNIGMR